MVSILAPLARGALRTDVPPRFSRFKFQSSPPSQGGRYVVSRRNITVYHCFNPRPPRKGGATGQAALAYDRDKSFNPRPPRKGGATLFA